jgi:hypothetical protein
MTGNGRALAAVVAACLVTGAGVAAADQRPAGSQVQTGGGPLVLQPSGDGPVVTPEVKFAKLGSDYGTLVGAYGGWLIDGKLLLGAGGYWLVDHGWHDPVNGMGYFGFVTAWTVPAGKSVHAGLRALVGFGQASFNETVTYPAYTDPHHGGVYHPGGSYQVQFWDDLFVFEPQATLLVRLSRGVALDAGLGFRVVAGAGDFNSRVRGGSASIGIRLGPHF